jgi:hypothetical protein
MRVLRNLGCAISTGLILAAGPSLAAGGSLSEVCDEFDGIFAKRVIDRLCMRHPSACDRAKASLEEFCGRSRAILATRSADSGVLDLLRQDYDVAAAEEFSPPGFLEHVVIGPSDLDRPEFLALARDALAVGRTVAITEANQKEADRFHRLLGGIGDQANCEEDSDSGIALYGLQQATTRIPPQLSSYCLASLGDMAHDDETRLWLRQRFGSTPPVRSSDAEVGGADVNLAQLASTLHCSHRMTLSGTTFQIDSWVSAIRSFDNSEDLQYVTQTYQFNPAATPQTYSASVCLGATGLCDPEYAVAFSLSHRP